MTTRFTLRRVALAALVINSGLFLLKLGAWLESGSMGLLSDGINSGGDVLSSVAIYVAARLTEKGADEGHPLGHARAETVAGITVAVLVFFAGLFAVRQGAVSLFSSRELGGVAAIPVLVTSVLVKVVLLWLFKAVHARTRSPAARAGATDSLADILASAAAGAGFLLGPLADGAAGIAVGAYVAFSGVRDYFTFAGFAMGKRPEERLLAEVNKVLAGCPVSSFHDVIAHHVGHHVHIEVHCVLDEGLSIKEAHDRETTVKRRLEELPLVERAYVHVDTGPKG